MQDEIKLLNEKLDYLKDGNRRLDGLYYERGERIQKLENELDTCQNQNSGNQVLERMIEGNVKIWKSSNFVKYNVYQTVHVRWLPDAHEMPKS